MRRRWQLQEAKARLSELVDSVQREGPQEITRRGEPSAVLVSHKEYQRLVERKQRFVEFIRRSPLAGLELELSRDKSPTRDVDL
jgi:prevent-host-death family protein